MLNVRTLLVALLFVCGWILSAALPHTTHAADKVIYMQAMEPKGTTSVEKEAFPGNTLPTGGGYKIKPPNKKGKWQVSTYIWNPNQVIVRKGDRVTLKIVGLNGAKHEGSIEHYLPKPFIVKRGLITTVKFTADKAGRFKIGCTEHEPSMTGELIVLDF